MCYKYLGSLIVENVELTEHEHAEMKAGKQIEICRSFLSRVIIGCGEYKR